MCVCACVCVHQRSILRTGIHFLFLAHPEKVVLRLLDPQSVLEGDEALGLQLVQGDGRTASLERGVDSLGGGGRERGREGESEGGRVGEREEGREGGREGGRE